MKYERFFQKIWTYFRSLSTCALHYINQTAPLFEILHHEKIETQNVTAMVKLNCLILILPDLLKKYIDAPHPNTAEKHKNKLLHTL